MLLGLLFVRMWWVMAVDVVVAVVAVEMIVAFEVVAAVLAAVLADAGDVRWIRKKDVHPHCYWHDCDNE